MSAAGAAVERPPSFTARVLVCSIPGLVVLSAAFLAVQSLRAWGAAEILQFPDWTPTVAGLIAVFATGTPNLFLLRGLVRLTRRPVSVSAWQLPFAALTSAAFAALNVLLALRLPKESSYTHLLENGEPVVTAGAAVAFAAVVGFVSLVLVQASAFLMQSAVQSNAGTRFDKSGREPDAIGALLARDDGRAL
ncbi:MAG TPA: hypothetical protein VNN10_02645 [Dehalococcoidia bacterium]|nr:hypothetical protein [Dehalococcoidia bacterium]